MYYEVHGSGDPLILVHGAFGSIEEWGAIPEGLAAKRQVVALELQGHGHTADVARPFGYEQLADDVAALMDHLAIEQADVIGYSMGGITALQLAIRHPEKVRKMVPISANFRSDGEYPEVLAGIAALTPDLLAGTPMEESYRRTAPNPDDFPILVEKLKTFFTTEFAISETDMRSIAAPALVALGDSDTVRPEHALEMFRLLGGGVPGDLTGLPSSQLAILPGTTHASIVAERTDLLLARIEAFLASPDPAAA
jgi:pimeloyl-ACP methyl ester carboxylesterase